MPARRSCVLAWQPAPSGWTCCTARAAAAREAGPAAASGAQRAAEAAAAASACARQPGPGRAVAGRRAGGAGRAGLIVLLLVGVVVWVGQRAGLCLQRGLAAERLALIAAAALPRSPGPASAGRGGRQAQRTGRPTARALATLALPATLTAPPRSRGDGRSHGRRGSAAPRRGALRARTRGAAHHGAGGAVGGHEVRLGDVEEAAAVLGRRARLARLGARPWRARAHARPRFWLGTPIHGFSPRARGGGGQDVQAAAAARERGRAPPAGVAAGRPPRGGGGRRRARGGGGGCARRAGTPWTWRAGRSRTGGRRPPACAGWPPAPPCWTRWRRSRPRTRPPPRLPSCCPRPAAPRPAAARRGVGRRAIMVKVRHALPLRRLWSGDAGMAAPRRKASGRPKRYMQRPGPA